MEHLRRGLPHDDRGAAGGGGDGGHDGAGAGEDDTAAVGKLLVRVGGQEKSLRPRQRGGRLGQLPVADVVVHAHRHSFHLVAHRRLPPVHVGEHRGVAGDGGGRIGARGKVVGLADAFRILRGVKGSSPLFFHISTTTICTIVGTFCYTSTVHYVGT